MVLLLQFCQTVQGLSLLQLCTWRNQGPERSSTWVVAQGLTFSKVRSRTEHLWPWLQVLGLGPGCSSLWTFQLHTKCGGPDREVFAVHYLLRWEWSAIVKSQASRRLIRSTSFPLMCKCVHLCLQEQSLIGPDMQPAFNNPLRYLWVPILSGKPCLSHFQNNH